MPKVFGPLERRSRPSVFAAESMLSDGTSGRKPHVGYDGISQLDVGHVGEYALYDNVLVSARVRYEEAA